MFHCEHIFLRILPFQRIFCLLLPVVWRLNKIGIDLTQVLTLRDFWTTMRQVSWLKIFFIRSQSRATQFSFLDVSRCSTCIQRTLLFYPSSKDKVFWSSFFFPLYLNVQLYKSHPVNNTQVIFFPFYVFFSLIINPFSFSFPKHSVHFRL